MEKKRFEKHIAGRGGWSKWVTPADGYLFKCCDCGLVHELEFRIFVETNRRKDGSFLVNLLPSRVNQVIRTQLRARRERK
jgi:hypothetical protein